MKAQTLREQVARGVSEWVDHALETHGRFDSHELADAIIGLLIPPGHVVVPVEPTEAMQNAGRIAAFRVLFPRGGPFEEADCQAGAFAAYRAMLAARPAGEETP